MTKHVKHHSPLIDKKLDVGHANRASSLKTVSQSGTAIVAYGCRTCGPLSWGT